MRGLNPEDPHIVKNLVVFAALLLSFSAFAASDRERAAIEERIKPVGEVCLKGDSGCGVASAAAASGPFSVSDTYASTCNACHAIGLAGAPKLGDDAEWAKRTAGGIDKVYANAINGKGGMPPKGTCMSCSDDDIKALVDYMIKGS